MTTEQLVRVRWGVRGALFLGVATSVAANVLHANDNPISQTIAAWPPLALLLTVELISRVPVHRRSLAAVRLAATASIAGIAAWVSYWHMAGVAARYGEVDAAPYLIPLSVDGLVVVASVCLVELAGRIRVLDTAPVTVADIPADTQPDITPEPEPAVEPETLPEPAPAVAPGSLPAAPPDSMPATASEPLPDKASTPRHAKRRTRKPSTATAVARLRTRHPELSTSDIARRLGVTDRTVRRHLSAASA